MVFYGWRKKMEDETIILKSKEKMVVEAEEPGCSHFCCSTCTKTFTSLKQLKHHISTLCERNKWKCVRCSEEFDSRLSLEKHSFIHKELPVVCEVCGIVSKTLYELKNHERVHSSCSCHVCGKRFSCSFDCQNHKLYCRPDEGQGNAANDMPFTCLICGMGFKMRVLFVVHLFTHSDEKAKECGKCGMKFNFVSRLRAQTLRPSAGVEQYACNICSQNFKSDSLLKTHLFNSHSRKKLYRCSVCQKQFKYLRSLQSHQFLHLDSKQRSCGLCKEVFLSKELLIKHLIAHGDSDAEDVPENCQLNATKTPD